MGGGSVDGDIHVYNRGLELATVGLSVAWRPHDCATSCGWRDAITDHAAAGQFRRELVSECLNVDMIAPL